MSKRGPPGGKFSFGGETGMSLGKPQITFFSPAAAATFEKGQIFSQFRDNRNTNYHQEGTGFSSAPTEQWVTSSTVAGGGLCEVPEGFIINPKSSSDGIVALNKSTGSVEHTSDTDPVGDDFTPILAGTFCWLDGKVHAGLSEFESGVGFTGDHFLIALDVEGGGEQWRVTLDDICRGIACDGEKIFTADGSGDVYAFDNEGNQLWKSELGAGPNGLRANIAVSNNFVMINAQGDNEQDMFGLNKDNGNTEKEATSVGQGNCCINDENGKFSNGTPNNWATNDIADEALEIVDSAGLDADESGAMATKGDHYYIADGNENIKKYNMNTESLVWSQSMPDRPRQITGSGDVLYVYIDTGGPTGTDNILGLDISDGSQSWSIDEPDGAADDDTPGGMLVGTEDALYVGYAQAELVAKYS